MHLLKRMALGAVAALMATALLAVPSASAAPLEVDLGVGSEVQDFYRCDGTIHDCKSLDDYRDWTAWDATTT